MSPHVTIGGLGLVTCFGEGVETTLDALWAGRRHFSPPRRYPSLGQPPVPVAEAPLTTPAGHVRALDMAVRSAREALQRDDWSAAERADARSLLVVATTKAGIELLTARMHGEPAPVFAEHGAVHALASRLADALEFGGAIATVSLACASGLIAVGHARRALLAGRYDRGLVVGTDASTAFVYRGFNRLGAMDPGGARPFDASRAGLTLGEGSAALTLRLNGHGPILAGYCGASDAHHITGPARDGRGLHAALRGALDEAELRAERVGAAIAHGTATRFNDAMEGVAYSRVFGQEGLPLTSVKGAVGHLMGAAGLLNAVVAVRALVDGQCPPTVGLTRIDPEIPLDVVQFQARPFDGDAVVTSASGFAGVNAALCLQRPGRAVTKPSQPTSPRVVQLTAAIEIPTERSELVAEVGARAARRLDALCLAAVAGTERLLRAAGTTSEVVGSTPHGLFLGTEHGCLDSDVAYYEGEMEGSEAEVSPRTFAYTLPNIALGEVALRHGWRGENLVFCAGAASGLKAMQAAVEAIASGQLERAVVLAVDAVGAAAARTLDIPPCARGQAWLLESAFAASSRHGRTLAELRAGASLESANTGEEGRSLEAALRTGGRAEAKDGRYYAAVAVTPRETFS